MLGRFWSRGDSWWLTNEGRSITIQIAEADSRSSVQLAPGSEIALSFPNSILRSTLASPTTRSSCTFPTVAGVGRRRRWQPLDADDEGAGATITLATCCSPTSNGCCCSPSARPRSGPPQRRRAADQPSRRPPARLVDHEVQPQAGQPVQPLHQARRRRPPRVDRPTRDRPPTPAGRARRGIRLDHPQHARPLAARGRMNGCPARWASAHPSLGVSRLSSGTGKGKPSTTAGHGRGSGLQSCTQSVAAGETSTASSPITWPIRPPLATLHIDTRRNGCRTVPLQPGCEPAGHRALSRPTKRLEESLPKLHPGGTATGSSDRCR